ncbi:hypothetical protein Pst134EB_014180 [Puccinia striiformis f. sp. tritici]|nr:hypothetical protein Pst134EB_014180 [Puccinia striiformis f. sp. tritici]
MDEISCTNNDNELLNISSALPELPGFSGLEASLPPLDDELLSLVPDVPPPDRGINPALINSRETSLALKLNRGTSALPESTRSTPVPRPVDRENFPPIHRPIPTLEPTGTAPARTQPTPTPSTGRESSMDIILEHPGLNSLVTILNNQWEMFVRARDSRDISMMRFSLNAGRRNPRDDPEQSRPRGNDPTQSGLERPRGTSSFGRAIPASEHPDAESRFTSGTPHGRLPPSSQQQQRRNAATTPSATTPAVGVLDESIYATPASFIAPSVPALSATGPDGPRLRTSTPLSPKRLRNQPVPTPSSRKLERIREEQEKTPERDSRSAQDGPIFHARRGRDGTHPTRSPNQNPSTASSDSKPPSSPPLNGSLLPILDNLSDASQRESMLRNINNEFLNDNPFLIEDKLHTLFSKFLSELSGTLESVPSTLLKSCVQNLSFTVNSAVVEAIKSTVIPSLLDKVLEQLRVSESELKPNQNNFDLTSIQSVISGKIEDLHDCMLVNESQRQADSDELKSTSYDFKEENMRRFNSINDQIGDLQINEHNRFELIQRRLGDICSTLNKVNDKVNSLFEPDDRDPAPHLTHNNPLMNNHQHFSIQEPAIPNQPTPEPAQKVSFAPPMVTHHEMRPAKHSQPPSDDDFPSLNMTALILRQEKKCGKASLK